MAKGGGCSKKHKTIQPFELLHKTFFKPWGEDTKLSNDFHQI